MNDGVHIFTNVMAWNILLIQNVFCAYSFNLDKRVVERLVYVADKPDNYYSQFSHTTYKK